MSDESPTLSAARGVWPLGSLGPPRAAPLRRKGFGWGWGRADTRTCSVCGYAFVRFLRIGFTPQASLNGMRRELSMICSAACAARRCRARHAPTLIPRPCAACGQVFYAKRKNARSCSTRCRVALHRATRVTLTASPTGVEEGTTATRTSPPRVPAATTAGDDEHPEPAPGGGSHPGRPKRGRRGHGEHTRSPGPPRGAHGRS